MANRPATADTCRRSHRNRQRAKSQMPIEQLFRLTAGASQEWGMEEYNVPLKSVIYKSRAYSMQSKKGGEGFFIDAITNKEKSLPGPANY